MKRLFLSVAVLIAVLLIASCSGATGSTTTPTSTTSITTTTIQTTTIPIATTPDASFGAPSVQELTEEGFILPELPRITAERLKQFMDEGEPLVVIDTRIKFLYDIGHLLGAINIPFNPEDAQTASFLILPKNRFIILYCD
ncbi:rhodanese-like domain-containing protein [Chloroflexota bacterium]